MQPIRSKLSYVQPVVFVLDGSASMDWRIGEKSKAHLVRETLRFVTRYFKNHDRRKKDGDYSGDYIYIQIIAFDVEAVKYYDDFVKITEVDEEKIESPTEKIRTVLRRSNKGTCISRGLRLARESIEDFVRNNDLDYNQVHKTAIILLSDGCTNKNDYRDLEDLSKEMNSVFNVFVIEFGESGTSSSPNSFHRRSCPELLQKVASNMNPEISKKYRSLATKFKLTTGSEFFKNKKLYIATLDEMHIKVIFITMSTIKRVLG